MIGPVSVLDAKPADEVDRVAVSVFERGDAHTFVRLLDMARGEPPRVKSTDMLVQIRDGEVDGRHFVRFGIVRLVGSRSRRSSYHPAETAISETGITAST